MTPVTFFNTDEPPLRKPKKVKCQGCGKRTSNEIARLCDACLKKQGQMQMGEE